MSSLEKKWHKVDLGGTNAKIWLPDVYGGTNGIGTALGITLMTDAEAANIQDAISLSDGLKNGQLVRLRLTVKDGTTGKSKSARVLCSIASVRTGITTIIGKTYRGNLVKSAGTPRRRRLG